MADGFTSTPPRGISAEVFADGIRDAEKDKNDAKVKWLKKLWRDYDECVDVF